MLPPTIGHLMRTTLSTCCLVLFVLALAGCDTEEIRTAKVPKPPPAPPTDMRLLAAVINHPPAPAKAREQLYVKMLGLAVDVAKQGEKFDAFVNSLAIGDKTKWTAPEGWEPFRPMAGAGPKPLASFRVGNGKVAPKVTVYKFTTVSPLLENVNRWRKKDLGLKPLDEKALAAEAKPIKAGKHDGDRVDMIGPGITEEPDDPMPAGPMPVEYKTPDGWKETGGRGGFVPILMAFSMAGGREKDEVTITQLGGGGGDVLGNVNRWRGQVGLGGLDKAPPPGAVAVGGVDGTRYDFVGPDRAMYLVLVPGGGRTWYFKLMADKAVAARHKDAFDAFLKSVKFPGGKG